MKKEVIGFILLIIGVFLLGSSKMPTGAFIGINGISSNFIGLIFFLGSLVFLTGEGELEKKLKGKDKLKALEEVARSVEFKYGDEIVTGNEIPLPNKIKLRPQQVFTEENEERRNYLWKNYNQAITNEELPCNFYEIKSVDEFFSVLELIGITKYNNKVEELTNKIHTFAFTGLYPYRWNYDGKTLTGKKDLFSGYSNKDREKLLEVDKDLARFGMGVIEAIQKTRLDAKRGYWGTLSGDQGVKIVRHINDEGDKFLSKNIMERTNKLYEEFKWFRGEDIPREDIKEGWKKRFPTEEIIRKEERKLLSKLLILGRNVIREVRQKLKKEYEAQR